jgi:hypothetical protein
MWVLGPPYSLVAINLPAFKEIGSSENFVLICTFRMSDTKSTRLARSCAPVALCTRNASLLVLYVNFLQNTAHSYDTGNHNSRDTRRRISWSCISRQHVCVAYSRPTYFLQRLAKAWLLPLQHIARLKRHLYPVCENLKMVVFWDVAPCSLVDIDRRFREVCCLYHGRSNGLQGGASPKCRSISTRLHGAASQKRVIFIFTAVRTLNFAYDNIST